MSDATESPAVRGCVAVAVEEGHVGGGPLHIVDQVSSHK